MRKLILFGIVLLMFASFASSTIYFYDDFDRADQVGLGNEWYSATGWEIYNNEAYHNSTSQTYAKGGNVTLPYLCFKNGNIEHIGSTNFYWYYNIDGTNLIMLQYGTSTAGILHYLDSTPDYVACGSETGASDYWVCMKTSSPYEIWKGPSYDNLTNVCNATVTQYNEAGIGIYNLSFSSKESGHVMQEVCGADSIAECVGVPPPPSINLSSPLPVSSSSFNVPTVNFNLTANASFQFNCSYYLNNAWNQTINEFSAGTNIAVDFNVTFGDDGEYRYIIGCWDGTYDINTSEITFFMDFTVPTVVTDFFNNSFFYKRNLTAQFNITDNILLHTVNISIDDKVIFNDSHVHETSFQYNLSWNVSNLTLGKHNINVYVADGHTAAELSEPYDWSNGLWNNYLQYDFLEGGFIRTESKEKSIYDDWDTERKIDRYTQTFVPANPGSTQTFIEESNLPIHIVNKPGYYKDTWIIIGNHWKDYVLENEPDSKVSIKRINDYSVEVTITEIKNIPERLEFDSIGDLNRINKSWDFYVVNLTDGFDTFILTHYPFEINLSMDFGELLFNISGLTPSVTLEINDTNFTASQITFNESDGLFRKAFTAAQSIYDGNVFHYWYFDLGNYTPELLETDPNNQTAIEIEINQCGTTANYTILNITHFDEVTDLRMNATNSYQLNIYDGEVYYDQTDSFPRNETSQLCTNLNPSWLAYNWDMWGTFTLSEPAYITRIVDISSATPIVLSNSPETNLSLFLIMTANSSTVKYNWFTKNFESITGTMRIYQCNPDGTQDLIESIPIIAGVATANIELLTQPYAYDIIINGQVFRDTNDYSRCHVESLTELTFYVETEVFEVGALMGLGVVPCLLTKVSNTSVSMYWTENSEQAGYVQGCMIAERRTITGNVEVLNNCSVEAEGYYRILEIPMVEGNTYTVRGELRQGGNVIVCGVEVVFRPSDEAGGLFSFTGLLAAFFLILALILMYSGDGERQMTAAAIGVVVAWIIGILNWGWLVTSSIVVFLILIALIGRHGRKTT